MGCLRCSKCCKTFPIDIGFSDISRWEKEKRKDILNEVSFLDNYPQKGYGGFYIEKSVKSPKQDCPFLKENSCLIYDTRPMVCKDYPMSHEKPECQNGFCPEKEIRDKIISFQGTDLKMSLNSWNDMMAILVAARR